MQELLQIGKSGLITNNRALDVIGNNVANVGNPDYSRQRADLESLSFQKNGLNIGMGVDISQVTQLRDRMIDKRSRENESNLGAYNQQIKFLRQIEGLLSTDSGSDLDKLLSSFFTSFSDLSNNPESLERRANVMNTASNLTARIREIDNQFDIIQQSVSDEAQAVTADINRILQQVAQLNVKISTTTATGSPDNASLDKRVQLLSELSTMADVVVTYNENDSAEVRVGNIVMVTGDRASTLTTEIDSVSNKLRFRINNGRSIPISKGSVGALVDLYENILPEYQTNLNTLSESLVTRINGMHRNGYDLNNNTGIDFFVSGQTSASTITVNPNLVSDTRFIAASGAANAPGDNTVATRIADLLNNTDAVNGQSYLSFVLNLSSETGQAISNLSTNIDATNSTLTLLKNQQDAVAGVNLDEELTNMIKFQNAYQAAARVITAADEMYQTLLNMV